MNLKILKIEILSENYVDLMIVMAMAHSSPLSKMDYYYVKLNP
jgi:hypothetical protein